MSGLFKIQRKGRRGSSNAPPRNAVPSTPTGEQSDLPIERIDLALEIASILKDASEGSPLLAPLKATCALIIRCLEVTRVRLCLMQPDICLKPPRAGCPSNQVRIT